MRITRPFVLLALAVLLAPRIEASRSSVWESNPPASLTAMRADAGGLLTPLAPAAQLETGAASDAEIIDSPRFDLGDVVLVESELENEDRFDLGPLELLGPASLRGPPSSYPETRVRGFELLPPFRIGASASLSLWPRQACGSISCGLASDGPEDPWGLSEQTQEMKEQQKQYFANHPGPEVSLRQVLGAAEAAIGAWWAAQTGGVGAFLGGSSLVWHGTSLMTGKENLVGAIVRGTGEMVRDAKGIKLDTPAKAELAAQNDAKVEGAFNNALVGLGMATTPLMAEAPLRTDGAAMPSENAVLSQLGASQSAKLWGTNAEGKNQGLVHFLEYWDRYPERIPSLEKRLGLPAGTFSQTKEGFDAFTAAADRVASTGTTRSLSSGRTIAFVEGSGKSGQGVMVIKKDGQLQSMMAGPRKFFEKVD